MSKERRLPFSYTRSAAVRDAMETLGVRHVLIPKYRPQANGKVERFNRTLLTEWAYRRLYPFEPGPSGSPASLGRVLQSAQAPHRAGRQSSSLKAVDNAGGNYS
jgi:transposase InsO family protein